MPATKTDSLIDKYWVDELLKRWWLSVDYIDGLEMNSLPAQDALKHVLRSDLPLIMRELTRLRPDLTLADSGARDRLSNL
jgi:hypothetical protein